MSWNRALLSAAAIAAALAGLPAVVPASPGGSVSRADERIAVKDNFFSERSVTVERGDKVKWVWKGENRHNVSFRKVPKDTSERGSGTKRRGKWSRTFWRPGRYSYVCTLFAGMRGEITVAEPAVESRKGLSGLEAEAPPPDVYPSNGQVGMREGFGGPGK
jgi:plastocyanin